MALSAQSINNWTRQVIVKTQPFLIRWRFVILLSISIALGIFELIEHPDFLTDNTLYFFKEMTLYYGLIIITAIMIEIALKSMIAKNQTIRILDIRHILSRQLIASKDWDEVVTKVLQFPASIMDVSATALFIYDQNTKNYISERSWIATSEKSEIQAQIITRDDCCWDDINTLAPNVHQLDCERITKVNQGKRSCYHITINYVGLPIGMFYIILPKHKLLTNEYAQIFSNTAEDIAIGLSTARQRQQQHAVEIVNTAANERLEIARDLHDTLGQNLGYLHFKLDQILTEGGKRHLGKLRPELEHLRTLSNESYELVRNTLVILHHRSNHQISDLFVAHTQIIANRWDFIQVDDRVNHALYHQ
jgi:signal transduction histidine kinase